MMPMATKERMMWIAEGNAQTEEMIYSKISGDIVALIKKSLLGDDKKKKLMLLNDTLLADTNRHLDYFEGLFKKVNASERYEW
jgi:hypothetical protein